MIIEDLISLNELAQNSVTMDFVRDKISLEDIISRGPTAIIGERGIGKTYLTLQLLKQSTLKSLYFSADNPLLAGIGLFDLCHQLYKDYGYRFLAIDEIHKGFNRQQELKSIVDSLPGLQLIVLGSSSLDLYKGTSALQRRIYPFHLSTLDFKEYYELLYGKKLPSWSFEELISNRHILSLEHHKLISIQDFHGYLQQGMYPFFKSKSLIYRTLLRQNLKKTLLEDLPTFLNNETDTLSKLEKLFYFIATNEPSTLSYDGLGKKLRLSAGKLETILYYLDQIGVINLAIRSNKLTDIIRKEYKVFLGNPNMHYCYLDEPQVGTIRESFVLQTIKHIMKNDTISEYVSLPNYGDFAFLYKGKQYILEVGGSSKKISNYPIDTIIITDNILISEGNKLPIWMLGLIE